MHGRALRRRLVALWGVALALAAATHAAPALAQPSTDAPVRVASAPTITAEELNRLRLLGQQINDPFFQSDVAGKGSGSWVLDNMRLPEAWQIARGSSPAWGERVTIAVIDSGFDINHEDLAANIVAPYNALTGGTDVGNGGDLYHGTEVAGVCGAVANNGRGIAGVSYNARIMPISVGGNGVDISLSALERAYDHVLEMASTYNIRVINLSLVLTAGVSSLKQKIDAAYEAGIVTVASAGNEQHGLQVPYASYPGDYDNVVSVMNYDGNGLFGGLSGLARSFNGGDSMASNYNRPGGRSKNICAPGTQVVSTCPYPSTKLPDTPNYDVCVGTSFAAPQVSGVLALMFSASPLLGAQQAIDILYSTARDLGDPGFDERTGYGTVNAYEAVKAARAKINDYPIYGRPVPITTQTYAITLDRAGGTGGTPAVYETYGVGVYLDSDPLLGTRKMTASSNPIEPPTRSGYRFLGYYDERTGGGNSGGDVGDMQLIDANGKITTAFTPTRFSTDATLRAWWEPSATITLDDNGGSGGGAAVYVTPGEGVYADAARTRQMTPTANPVAVPTRLGCEFLGYYAYDFSAKSWGAQMIDANGYRTSLLTPASYASHTTLYAHWAYATYAITLDQQGGTSASYGGHVIDKVYQRYNSWVCWWAGTYYYLGHWIVPSKDGSDFLGYYSSVTGGTKMIDADGMPTASFTTTRYTGDATLHARWRPRSYDITLDVAGGALSVDGWKKAQGSGAYAQTVPHGTSVTLPTPTRAGLAFKGWTGSGLAKPTKSPAVTVTAAATFTAVWSTSCTVTLSTGGGTTSAAGWAQVAAGKTYTLEAKVGSSVALPRPERAGYTFLGWRGGGLKATTPELTTTVSSDVTYRAKWERDRTVTLSTGGGTVSDGGWQQVSAGKKYTQVVPYGSTVALPTPARAGYAFVGWKRSGRLLSADPTVTANVTYTAVWSVVGSQEGPGVQDQTQIQSTGRTQGQTTGQTQVQTTSQATPVPPGHYPPTSP